MLSTLKQFLTGSLLSNPWAILAVFGLLVSSHGYVSYKAYTLGGDRAALACEKRIDKLNTEIEKQQAEIDKANSAWKAEIDKVTTAFNDASQSRQDTIDKLEQDALDYEKTLEELRKVPNSTRNCKLDRRDL